MMNQQEEEKKNKKRGILIAFFIHLIIIGLALIPFMHYSMKEQVPLSEAVEIMVFDFSRSREGASSRAAPRPQTEMTKKSPAPAEADIFKIEPLPVPEVITTSEPEKIKLPEPSMPQVQEVPDAKSPTVRESDSPTAQEATEAAPSAEPSGSNQTGTSTSEGNTDAIEGEGKGSRSDGMDFSGKGILTRKIISRPNMEAIIKQDGVIVVNVCVNQRGRVVGAKYNEELSTITDKKLITKAIDIILEYKFEQDYSAAYKECGRISITIKGTK